MRIFYCNNVFDHPQTGGERFYARVLADLRAREGVELMLPSETDLRFLNRPENCLGINLYFFNRFRHVPRNTIVIESENFYYSFFLANWAARICRRDVRFLASVLQVPSPLERRAHHRLLRDNMLWLFLHSVHAITVNSQYLAQQLATGYGVPEDRIHTVYSSGQTLVPIPRRPGKDGNLRLLCVGHIRSLKGQGVLVKALSRLRDGHVELALVGGTKDGNYESELRALIGELGLEKRVRLVGRLDGDDLACAYAEADIFVLPSLYEAYGIVVQEAMSFSLPIVASNVGGIPEQVRNGVEGFLVPPGDEAALADALQKLIINPGLRVQMGKRARKRVAELLTWDEVCERFYQALMPLQEKR